MRWIVAFLGGLTLCALGGAAAAQDQPQPGPEPEPDALAPIGAPPQGWAQGGLPGAEARFDESLRLLARRLETEPADVPALERALVLCDTVGRTTQLLPRVRKACAARDLSDGDAAALDSLLGHLLVAKANETGGGMRIFVFGPGGGMQVQRDEDAVKLFREAVEPLRRAIAKRPRDARALHDLADALEGIDEEANAEEVSRLRNEANAIEAAATPGGLPFGLLPRDWSDRVQQLQARAAELEQQDSGPDHAAALRVRNEAMVLEFTNGTLPFQYTASLDEPVSLLAPVDIVRENLTRSYRKQSGDIDFVPPLYHPPAQQRRLELVRVLGNDESAGATAVLLAVLIRAGIADEVGEAALDALSRGERKELGDNLPALLATAFSPDFEWQYPAAGQRWLVTLAARRRAEAAAPVILAALARPGDLYLPRGLAGALAAIRRPGDAETLLGIARDASADVYFRRRAVDALAALGADLPDDLAADPAVGISVTAARLAREPSEALEGRLLALLGDDLQADDAAAYCAKLGLRKAIPLIEDRLGQARESAIAGPLAAALAALRGES